MGVIISPVISPVLKYLVKRVHSIRMVVLGGGGAYVILVFVLVNRVLSVRRCPIIVVQMILQFGNFFGIKFAIILVI